MIDEIKETLDKMGLSLGMDLDDSEESDGIAADE